MKNQNRFLILLLCTFAFSFLAFVSIINAQTNYYSTGSGTWKNTTKWSPSYPGETIVEGDSVFVRHNMTISSIDEDEITVKGTLVVESAGKLSGNNEIKVKTSGELINNGSISLNKEIHVDGTLYNNNTIDVKKLHIDGYLCNPGTVSINGGQKIDLHGGLIECGGSLITNEIKIHDNDDTGETAILQDQSICSHGGGEPIFDYESGIIDSASVIVCGFALPVELSSYDVKLEDNTVRIDWSTASEINNDYFVVERSQDAYKFDEIILEVGAGSSDEFRYYSVSDRFPFKGISYYRLKQVDFDGKTTNFDIKMVDNNDGYTNEHSLSVFPNPIVEHSSFNIGLEGFGGNEVLVKIQNMSGIVVYSEQISISQEGELLKLESTILKEAGMYIVSVFNNGQWYHHKFMFVK